MDSVINIFSRWRGHTLSLAGRRCLINSVIASSLVHTMMVYRWPKSLLHWLEVAIRSYLWTWDETKKGFSNVDWKRSCAPLTEGGFKIRSLRLANASFCCKLAWDFLTTTDTQALFIQNRYFDVNGNPINHRRRYPFGPGCMIRLLGSTSIPVGWLGKVWTCNSGRIIG